MSLMYGLNFFSTLYLTHAALPFLKILQPSPSWHFRSLHTASIIRTATQKHIIKSWYKILPEQTNSRTNAHIFYVVSLWSVLFSACDPGVFSSTSVSSQRIFPAMKGQCKRSIRQDTNIEYTNSQSCRTLELTIIVNNILSLLSPLQSCSLTCCAWAVAPAKC